MASLYNIAFTSALFLVLFTHQVKALSCYTCESTKDPECAQNDNVPDKFKAECATGKQFKTANGTKVPYTFCRKIVQVIEFKVHELEPDTRVIRGCGWDDSSYKGRCYQRAGFGGRQEVCACYGDNCNSASSIGLMFSAALFSSTLYLFASV